MQKITVQVLIQAPIKKVWEHWAMPGHIKNWNHASDDWQCPRAENDLSVGGKFIYRMEAKDGSMGFDFMGVYDEIKVHQLIQYTIDGGRKVEVIFEKNGDDNVKVTEIFEPETDNPIEMQRDGWQAILDNFKKYVEAND